MADLLADGAKCVCFCPAKSSQFVSVCTWRDLNREHDACDDCHLENVTLYQLFVRLQSMPRDTLSGEHDIVSSQIFPRDLEPKSDVLAILIDEDAIATFVYLIQSN